MLTGFSGSRFAVTDVTVEGPDPIPESRRTPLCASFSLFVRLMVLALEPLDLSETLDPSSFSLDVFPNQEFLEFDLDAISSSCSCDIRLGVAFLRCVKSVSGGLGGRPFL